MGYDNESSSYRCYDPITKVASVSRHVTFNDRESGVGSEVLVSEVELALPMQSEIEEYDYQDAEDSEGVVVGNAGDDDEAADNARAGHAAERQRGRDGKCRKPSTTVGARSTGGEGVA